MALMWLGSHRWEVKRELNCAVGLACVYGGRSFTRVGTLTKEGGFDKKKSNSTLSVRGMLTDPK